jgi:hypothetical protein
MSQGDDIPCDSENLSRLAEAERVNFLAKYALFQKLSTENEELNRKKQKTRPWGSKRQLFPPAIKKAAKTKRQPARGAPLKNRNRLKHGKYSAETLAFWATISACVRTSKALVAEAKPHFPASKDLGGRPRSATGQSV